VEDIQLREEDNMNEGRNLEGVAFVDCMICSYWIGSTFYLVDSTFLERNFMDKY
jgi:hypothetical protein